MIEQIDEMFEAVKYMMEAAEKQEEIFKIAARLYKKTLDAMMAEGFSREEAVLIMAHQGNGIGKMSAN
jgi:hypothetical protein